jgi:hypothetical protein
LHIRLLFYTYNPYSLTWDKWTRSNKPFNHWMLTDQRNPKRLHNHQFWLNFDQPLSNETQCNSTISIVSHTSLGLDWFNLIAGFIWCAQQYQANKTHTNKSSTQIKQYESKNVNQSHSCNGNYYITCSVKLSKSSTIFQWHIINVSLVSRQPDTSFSGCYVSRLTLLVHPNPCQAASKPTTHLQHVTEISLGHQSVPGISRLQKSLGRVDS